MSLTDYCPELSNKSVRDFFNSAPDCGYLSLEGELDLFCNENIDAGYNSFLDSDSRSLIVDFEKAIPRLGTNSFGTSVVAKMIEFGEEVKSREGQLAILMDPHKRRYFDITSNIHRMNFLE